MDIALALSEGVAAQNEALAAERNGDYQRAEELHQRAIAVKEAGLPPKHISLGISYNAYGELLLYHTEGRLDEAEKWLTKAVNFRNEVAPESFDAAVSRENLAQLYEARGNPTKAKELRLSHPQAMACAYYHCSRQTLKVEDMKVCGKCKSILYCSPRCQTEDWKRRHKRFCKEHGA